MTRSDIVDVLFAISSRDEGRGGARIATSRDRRRVPRGVRRGVLVAHTPRRRRRRGGCGVRGIDIGGFVGTAIVAAFLRREFLRRQREQRAFRLRHPRARLRLRLLFGEADDTLRDGGGGAREPRGVFDEFGGGVGNQRHDVRVALVVVERDDAIGEKQRRVGEGTRVTRRGRVALRAEFVPEVPDESTPKVERR